MCDISFHCKFWNSCRGASTYRVNLRVSAKAPRSLSRHLSNQPCGFQKSADQQKKKKTKQKITKLKKNCILIKAVPKTITLYWIPAHAVIPRIHCDTDYMPTALGFVSNKEGREKWVQRENWIWKSVLKVRRWCAAVQWNISSIYPLIRPSSVAL